MIKRQKGDVIKRCPIWIRILAKQVLKSENPDIIKDFVMAITDARVNSSELQRLSSKKD